MSSSLTSASKPGSTKGPTSKVISPSRTPEENLKNLGGMPPTKKIEAINSANEPKKAPGSVMGAGE